MWNEQIEDNVSMAISKEVLTKMLKIWAVKATIMIRNLDFNSRSLRG